jgi:hypothetical protein
LGADVSVSEADTSLEVGTTLQLVGEGDCVVFERNVALAGVIIENGISADAIMASTLAGIELDRRADISPV